MCRSFFLETKLICYLSHSEGPRFMPVQEDENLQPENRLDLLSDQPFEIFGDVLFSHCTIGSITRLAAFCCE